MAFVRSSLKTGSAPGPTPTSPAVKVCDNGQVSTESSYATANFTESIADYEYVVVIFRRGDTGLSGESDVNRGIIIKVSDIVANNNSLNYTYASYGSMAGFWRAFDGTITLTTISVTNYGGAYNNLYCDVYAYPAGTLRYPD